MKIFVVYHMAARKSKHTSCQKRTKNIFNTIGIYTKKQERRSWSAGILACTMAQRGGDERFYLPARQAAGRFAALQKQMGGHTDVYAVDNHSCVINAAMEELAKPERSVERKTANKDAPER